MNDEISADVLPLSQALSVVAPDTYSIGTRIHRFAAEDLFSLRGRVALVTGASSGLGVECAKALASAGADVAIVARRKDRLDRLADELRAFGGEVLAIGADVTVDADLDRMVEEAAAELGEVDILVNNAGVSSVSKAEKLPAEEWDHVFAVNTRAPMLLSQRVARRLIERKSAGRIINISSIYGNIASAVYPLSAYAASKAALANLTRQLAVEWARYNINVNAIAPGWIPTEMTFEGIAEDRFREKMEKFTPQRRLGRPEEIGGAVIFLASAASSYVTGAIVPVDGGYQAW